MYPFHRPFSPTPATSSEWGPGGGPSLPCSPRSRIGSG
jgi:hypothetical protein